MILTSHEKKTHARFNASHYLFILTEMFGPFNIVTTKSDLANRYILILFFFFIFFLFFFYHMSVMSSCLHGKILG